MRSPECRASNVRLSRVGNSQGRKRRTGVRRSSLEHLRQLDWPFEGWKYPARHDSQALDPVEPLTVPTVQLRQFAIPRESW